MPVHRPTLNPPALASQEGSALPAAVSEGPARGAPQGGPLAGIPILVVDDDPPSARLVRVLLTGAGADVRTAFSAEEALDLLREFPAHAFVVDLILPGMSGFVLARRLRAAFPGAVVVAISVAHGAETERVAIEAGCVALLHKPIDVTSFAQTIADHLRRAA